MLEQFESLRRRGLMGAFFTASLAPTVYFPGYGHLADKPFFVVRPVHRDDLVGRCLFEYLLGDFLQTGFAIKRDHPLCLLQVCGKMLGDEQGDGREAAVEVDGAQYGLVGRGQDGGFTATAAPLLAPSHTQPVSEREGLGFDGEHFRIDQRGAHL